MACLPGPEYAERGMPDPALKLAAERLQRAMCSMLTCIDEGANAIVQHGGDVLVKALGPVALEGCVDLEIALLEPTHATLC